jgi:phage shock protein C
MEKRLHRDEHRKMIAGVCAGLADYFSIDPTIIRVLFLATLILHGSGVLIYIILWIVLPVKNYMFNNPTVDYKVPPNPFESTPPFGSSTSFGNMPPQNPGDPFTDQMPSRRSSGTIIAGTILILMGSFFLLDEFNFIPDWDFSRLWPAILIAVGLVFILARSKKQPWEHDNWHPDSEKDTAATDSDKKEETPNDNPTTL